MCYEVIQTDADRSLTEIISLTIIIVFNNKLFQKTVTKNKVSPPWKLGGGDMCCFPPTNDKF